MPKEYRQDSGVDAETLVLMGNLDFSSPVEYVQQELMPHLKRGRLVVLPNMGHVEFTRLQPEAFNHLADRFFYKGEVDASKFVHHNIDFTPDETLQDHAHALFQEGGK